MRCDKKEHEEYQHSEIESFSHDMQDVDGLYPHHDANENDHDIDGTQNPRSFIKGHHGDDRLVDGAPHAILTGAEGHDELDGGEGDDVLIGGGDQDVGHHQLSGGMGDDILIAGGHKTKSLDRFLIEHPELIFAITADTRYADLASIVLADVGTDFSGVRNTFVFHEKSGIDHLFNFHTETDNIQLDKNMNNSGIRDIASLVPHLSISGENVCIDLGGQNQLTLVGIDLTKISADNIVFV